MIVVSHETIIWAQIRTILALQAGVLAAAYIVRGSKFVVGAALDRNYIYLDIVHVHLEDAA